MTVKHHRITVSIVALVVAVIAAPTAFAYQVQPNPDESALIAAQQRGQHVTQAPAVRPNPDEIGRGPRSLSAQELAAFTQPQIRVVPVESSPGFSWSDAGIGAGAAVAVMFALGGCVLIATQRRERSEGSIAA